MTASLIVRTVGGLELPLVCKPSQVAPLLGRSDHAIRDDCAAGVIPTLPRAGGSGAHHRIATARFLDQIGIPYEIVSSEERASLITVQPLPEHPAHPTVFDGRRVVRGIDQTRLPADTRQLRGEDGGTHDAA